MMYHNPVFELQTHQFITSLMFNPYLWASGEKLFFFVTILHGGLEIVAILR